MRELLKTLYELQEIDVQIAGAKRAKAALDDGSSIRLKVQALDKQLQELTARLKAFETESRDCDLNLKSIETKKQNFEKRLYGGGIGNPKELEGIEKEIAMLTRNKDAAETRMLELMDEVESSRKAVKAKDAEFAQKSAELEVHVGLFNARSAELTEKMAQLGRERESKAGTIDEPMLRRYESIRAHSGGMAIGRVDDDRCGACHVGITPYSMGVLRKSEDVQVCESCGRLLYLPEE